MLPKGRGAHGQRCDYLPRGALLESCCTLLYPVLLRGMGGDDGSGRELPGCGEAKGGAEVSHAWERREGETSKAFAAFCVYRDLGHERSIDLVHKECSKSANFLRRWSARHEWVIRAADYDVYLDSVRREGIAQAEKSTAMRRHLQNARDASALLIDVGSAAMRLAKRSVEAYSKLPAESVQPSEAAALARAGLAALQVGLDAEAHSLGVAAAVSALVVEDG